MVEYRPIRIWEATFNKIFIMRKVTGLTMVAYLDFIVSVHAASMGILFTSEGREANELLEKIFIDDEASDDDETNN